MKGYYPFCNLILRATTSTTNWGDLFPFIFYLHKKKAKRRKITKKKLCFAGAMWEGGRES